MKKFKMIAAAILSGVFAVLPLSQASAASTVVVTAANPEGWSTADTRANGHVSFVADSSAPLGAGALSLITDAAPAPSQDKAQYIHSADVPLSDIDTLAYATKQNSASFVGGDPSYQLIICLTGFNGSTCNANTNPVTPANATSFTTLVYEPYQNGTVTPGVWQTWDVDAGDFWSSRSADCGTGSVQAGGGGTFFYSLDDLAAACPDADVIGYGVNIGSNNPGYNVETDALVFNDITYDFEPAISLTNKDECKNGGWQTSNSPVYKNQGDCVSSFASKGKAKGNPTF